MKNGQRPAPIPFDDIAPWYDFLNHFLSLGIDRQWRKKLIRKLPEGPGIHVLDVATGTADLAILAARKKSCRVSACDISRKMMAIGKKKAKAKGLDGQIEMIWASAEDLPFDSNHFDAVMVAFGVRNFVSLENGLAEMYRVVKPGGNLLVLEFSTPRNPLLRAIYLLYFRRVLPVLGGLLSKNRKAYDYLPESVLKFPQGETFMRLLETTGFKRTDTQPLTGGIATLYTAYK
jgi:demethylmenaquinone methyltransferase/2-methoxy-6-polyprenyl-1,4-benzoquinol methylase